MFWSPGCSGMFVLAFFSNAKQQLSEFHDEGDNSQRLQRDSRRDLHRNGHGHFGYHGAFNGRRPDCELSSVKVHTRFVSSLPD
jgi:hypothetical protein